MSYLYQLINDRYGTKSRTDRINKQRELYNAMGGEALHGKYNASYDQNMYLMNNQNKWGNSVLPSAPVSNGVVQNSNVNVAPTQGRTIAQEVVSGIMPNPINTPTSFKEVLPESQIINDQVLKDFAYSRVDPEVNRLKADASRNLMGNLSSSGAWRTGAGAKQWGDLGDNYSRMREEMANPFYQEGKNRLTDYYNQLETEYYKDPNSFDFKAIKPLSFYIS